MYYTYKKKTYRILFSALDAAGTAFTGIFRKGDRENAGDLRRILLVRLDHIGDVINSTCMLAPLRKRFPGSRIDFLGPRGSSELILDTGLVDGYIPLDASWFRRDRKGLVMEFRDLFRMASLIRKGKYDACIDMRGDFRHILAMSLAGVRRRIGYGITGGGFLLTDQVPYQAGSHQTEKNLRLLGALGVQEPAPELNLSFSDSAGKKARAYGLIDDVGLGNRDFAVVHVVPGHLSKAWPLANFAKVIDFVGRDKGLVPVVVGSAEDNGTIEKLRGMTGTDLKDLSGKTGLGELFHVIARSRMFIGVDSCPAHLAAAAGVPSVVLFSGVNDPAEWAPRGNNVRVICPGGGRELDAVQAEEVIGVIEELSGRKTNRA